MPFLAERHLPIPETDILSWIFDGIEERYDFDRSVCYSSSYLRSSFELNMSRSLSMP